MSILRKFSTFDKLLIKNGFLTISASYSRRSREEYQSDYKVVRNKSNVKGLWIEFSLVLHNILLIFFIRINLERTERFQQEGGPNWEIFNPSGNRFYLPNASGPGWHSPSSTIGVNVKLEKLVDFYSMVNSVFVLIKSTVLTIFVPFSLESKQISHQYHAMSGITSQKFTGIVYTARHQWEK